MKTRSQYTTDYPIQEVTLERIYHCASTEIDRRNVARYAELREEKDILRDSLRMTLTASVFGRKHKEEHVIRFPANWLEAVKERFAPVWMRDRWPVKFTVVTASLTELYPGLEPVLPDKTTVFRCYVKKGVDYPAW